MYMTIVWFDSNIKFIWKYFGPVLSFKTVSFKFKICVQKSYRLKLEIIQLFQ